MFGRAVVLSFDAIACDAATRPTQMRQAIETRAGWQFTQESRIKNISCPVSSRSRSQWVPTSDHKACPRFLHAGRGFPPKVTSAVSRFADLIASRRDWIERVLKPWCRGAPLEHLKRAELEWDDIAGKVDAKATLWTWAWGRFPDIVHEGLAGVDETHAVRVTLKRGRTHIGYPDNRKTTGGQLFLLSAEPEASGRAADIGPLSIDEIVRIDRA
jgi:hypothetical protein